MIRRLAPIPSSATVTAAVAALVACGGMAFAVIAFGVPSVAAQEIAAQETAAQESAAGTPLLVGVELRHPTPAAEEEIRQGDGGDALEITVGDPLEAVLTVAWMGAEPAGDVRLPTWQETWGDAEVRSVGEVDRFTDASGRRVWRQRLEITAFRTGEAKLPPVTVALPLGDRTVEARSDELSFTVRSVLPEATDASPAEPSAPGAAPSAAPAIPEPKGPAEPLALHSGDRAFLWTLAALLVLALAVLLLVARAVARQPALAEGEAEPVDPLRLLPPLEELRERLRRIDPAAGAEPSHTALSTALRTYLGRRLHFRAVESTTTEIQRALRRAAVAPEVGQRVLGLLRRADAVKFARFRTDEETTRRRVEEAVELGREIERAMAPTERLQDAGDEGGRPGPSPSRKDAARREAA